MQLLWIFQIILLIIIPIGIMLWIVMHTRKWCWWWCWSGGGGGVHTPQLTLSNSLTEQTAAGYLSPVQVKRLTNRNVLVCGHVGWGAIKTNCSSPLVIFTSTSTPGGTRLPPRGYPTIARAHPLSTPARRGLHSRVLAASRDACAHTGTVTSCRVESTWRDREIISFL